MTQSSNFIGTMFTSSNIVFEDKIVNNDLIPIKYSNSHFGILNLNAIYDETNTLSHEFIFMVDRSASMEDICGDGKTKMQHICHILKNMVAYFHENKSINAHITICTFDDHAYTVIERTQITDTNLNQIIITIDNIRSRGCTDIELALKHINSCCATIRTEFPTHNICSVFMTDGQISKGVFNRDILSGLIDRTINNAFIGVGLDHDGPLLTTLGTGKKSNYYFIDKLENSGFVYGEILHGEIYKILTNIRITIENGLIYNFKNNIWCDTLEIDNIVSDSNKTYHIAAQNPHLCCATISGNRLNGEEMETISILKHEGFVELEKYIYRQRTLQHLYNITEFNERQYVDPIYDIFSSIDPRTTQEKQSVKDEQKNIRNALEDFMKEIKIYMTSNNLRDDSFMKNLCDDIYICYRTFATKYSTMYSVARQTSQGTQRCYTVNHTPPRLVRQTNAIYCPHMFSRSTSPMPYSLDLYVSDDDDSENDLTHSVANFDDTQSPYSTQSSVKIMRAISSGATTQPQPPVFDEEYYHDSDDNSIPFV